MAAARRAIALLGLSGITSVAAFIFTEEGVELTGYKDVAGVPTACVGHTATAEVGKRYSLEECEQLFKSDFSRVSEEPMRRHVKVPLSEDEGKALASLVFNVGAQAITPGNSTLIRYLNSGQYREACNQILQWKMVNNKDCAKNGSGCAGIWKRRLKERDICMYGTEITEQRLSQP